MIDKWQGYALEPQGEVLVQDGPMILIRHPQWTAQRPRQDIPIIVFTPAQWTGVQQGEFLVSAAGVGPTELGRNASYVFGLPPRYNYALLPGFEEVTTILAGNPLHTP